MSTHNSWAYLEDNLKLEFKLRAGIVAGMLQEMDKRLLSIHFLI